jgi:subtilisin family serine protease
VRVSKFMSLKPQLWWVLSVLCLRAVGSEATVSVLLQLDGTSSAEQALAASDGSKLANIAVNPKQHRAALQARQANLVPGIMAAGGRITGRFVTLVNAVRVLVPESRIGQLESLPGVARVQRLRHYQRTLTHSVPWIGAPVAWSAAGGLTGKGVRLGIIDSGIDYLHADFGGNGQALAYKYNDPTIIEPGTFPTAKVVGGTDLVGDNYDADGVSGSPVPSPDPDPLDPAANGHGTHVAGIAAGLGVTADGSTYAGPYDTTTDFSKFKVGPGVAPGASLYAIKIFGSAGTTDAVIDGLEWAADPDGDGDTGDHLDVVNLSLGGAWGHDDPNDVELQAVNRLAQLGCVVVVSAGNDGNTSYILGAPGVAARAITVASTFDNAYTALGLRVLSPTALAGDYAAIEGDFTAPLAKVGPIRGAVAAADPFDACGALQNAGALSGKIALMQRGTCFYADKIRAAQQAGAIGVIMVNNVDGLPVVMGGTGDTSDITVPGVMISLADGKRLQAQLTNAVTVALSTNDVIVLPQLADQIDDFSSRGPVYENNRLKPDLAAPGDSITSARAGSGSSGISMSGTSMAAPHVAGAAALLKQAHPDWPVEDIKAALMDTAIATHDHTGNAYPESLTGAGRLRVDRAAATTVIAKAADGAGDVSLAFGGFDLAGPFTATRSIQLVNHGTADVMLTASASNTVVETGVTLTPLSTRVSVPAGGTVTLAVRLDADPAKFTRVNDPTAPDTILGVPRQQLPESSGEIWFQNATVAIHLPWHVILRATSQFAATAPNAGLPAGATGTIFVPTRGPSAHGAPLVAAFQFGATDASQGFSDDRAGTDILAVGAASDRAVAGSITNTTLYFGLAFAGKWLTPQRVWNSYDIEVDVNNDGQADYTLVNGNGGTFAQGDVDSFDDSNGAMETLVRNEITGQLTEETPFNVLDPAFRDPAPFQNGALIHAARAADLGLSETNSVIHYRAVTDGPYADKTVWINFDAANAILDPTPFGLRGTPIFDEGLGVQVGFNRANAGVAPFTKALLLHLHGALGRHYEVVNLYLNQTDVDGDGLPDAWELAHFGDLSFDGDDDPDGDGVDNAAEYARGTDPLKLRFLTPGKGVSPLRWFSPAGRYFTIERTTNLAAGFQTLQRRILTTKGTNTFTDPSLAGGGGPYFYRLRSE